MTSRLLKAIEDALRAGGKPLTAKALVLDLADRGEAVPGGLTPWKTVGARLAVDIRSNAESRFMRVGRGMYALSEWSDLAPVEVPRRRINPLDEDILAVDFHTFEKLKSKRRFGRLFNIDYRDLLVSARPIHRMKAEEDSTLVQLIPSFIIFEGNCVLSYKRTKKTPEQRLHDTFSIIFGGHLQAEDNPALFAHDADEIERFLFRELHEELAFDPPLRQSRYVGVLHLEDTAFERQHAGVVFAVDLEPGTVPTSLEPGYHSTLRFVPWDGIETSQVMDDRWSAACIAHILEAE